MPRIDPELQRLKDVRTFTSLIKYLKEELSWPIPEGEADDVSFHYDPVELGFNSDAAAKIDEVKQLRPLDTKQKWGIFWVKFGKKQLPVQMLRRALGNLVVKKRASTNNADIAAWKMNDLLFISAYGDDSNRRITFAHFSESKDSEKSLPVLKVLSWDDDDTVLHLKDTYKKLVSSLKWETTPTDDPEAWRTKWSSAFTLEHREVIETTKELVVELAQLAIVIKKSVLTTINVESEKGPWKKLLLAFRKTLIKDLDENQFADVIAQTVSYGLLTARLSSNDPISLKNLVDMVPSTNPFLKELLQHFLTSAGMKGLFDVDEVGINEVVELLNRANAQAIRNDFGKKNTGEDPVIHFYEHFLDAYDKKIKIENGVFYTPQPVVSYIVRNVNELLKTEFGLEDGLADTSTWADVKKRHKDLRIPEGIKSEEEPFVQILDPATGTATFLIEVIDVIYGIMKTKWDNEHTSKADQIIKWNNYVPKHLLPRLHAFELMMAPYAIAHMKVGIKLAETGYDFHSNERARIYLTNTLESWEHQGEFEGFEALAHESSAVNEIKRLNLFTVIIGNPPYLREKERGPDERGVRLGDWVRFGDPGSRTPPLFDDFIKSLSDTSQGVHAKLAYELSVMFWRLSLWATFERGAKTGIIAMISPRAYIAGPGHNGMRKWIKDHCSNFWVTDLGGDNRGARKTENVFKIETGVCIGLCMRTPKQSSIPCKVNYIEVAGTADNKLGFLRQTNSMNSLTWKECQPKTEPFIPESDGRYSEWPKITDIFPWQHSGAQFKRLWPIAESPSILEERWKRLLSIPGHARSAAYIETRDRVIADPPVGSKSKRNTGVISLKKGAKKPLIMPYCYRTFDRQWAFVDERLADYIRPSLLSTLSAKQIFAFTLMSKQLGKGPSIGITPHLPDMDIFCNRGAKDIIPLWRDAAGTQPNLTVGLLEKITGILKTTITIEDLFSYCVAILSGPAYSENFEKELSTPCPRIPITRDNALFKEVALIGAKFINLQSYGERWGSLLLDKNVGITGSANVKIKIPDDPENYPSEFSFDSSTCELKVGSGIISGVSPVVFGYSQSGFKPVESWLRYRMKVRGGRAKRAKTSSQLDQIRPSSWIFTDELLQLIRAVEGCINLWPEHKNLLEEVISGETIHLDQLPHPNDSERQEPTDEDQQQLSLI